VVGLAANRSYLNVASLQNSSDAFTPQTWIGSLQNS
jgi:hypothetical protein